jgi:hypothetical protein
MAGGDDMLALVSASKCGISGRSFNLDYFVFKTVCYTLNH